MAPPADDWDRVDWVDYAKGLCIILVVTMHSTLGVEEALGRESWLHGFVAWARPFRMPDFFLVGGLFLSRAIDRPWRAYLDRKVLHFLYFFVLWTLIEGTPKMALAGTTPGDIVAGLAFAMIEPFGSLWFIYLLPLFYVATKLLRRVPPEIVLVLASLLQMATIRTGWTVVDEFAGRYVYFFAGYVFAPEIFDFAARVRSAPRRAPRALVLWSIVNAAAVATGLAPLPGMSLFLGFAGAAAVVAFSALLAETRLLPALAALGSRSLVVYLAFFLPMAITRAGLITAGVVQDPGALSLIVTIVAIVIPLALERLVRGSSFAFLFERPAMFRLAPQPQRPGPDRSSAAWRGARLAADPPSRSRQ
jgi:uncharacterized membrane protein YcfT